MNKVLRTLAVLLLLVSSVFAQTATETEYDIPDGTGIEYIFYGHYTNTFFGSYPLTLGGVSYQVHGVIHFTEGNPTATSGSISFTHYTVTGSTTYTENLSNINYDPFTLTTATATASFAGQFNGSLTFNIQVNCRGRYCFDELETVNGVHSNFKIAQ